VAVDAFIKWKFPNNHLQRATAMETRLLQPAATLAAAIIQKSPATTPEQAAQLMLQCHAALRQAEDRATASTAAAG
jgi:hypothetical protein